MVRVVDCKQLVDDFWRGARLDPAWVPDPAPDQATLHLWQVLVRGLAAGQRVMLEDRQSRPLTAVDAGRDGAAYLLAVGEPVVEGRELSLRRGDAATRYDDGLERSVQIRQVLLQLAAAVVPDERPQTIRMGRYERTPVLVSVGPSHTQAYDLTDPTRPLPLEEGALGRDDVDNLGPASQGPPEPFGDVGTQSIGTLKGVALLGDVLARWQADNGGRRDLREEARGGGLVLGIRRSWDSRRQ